MRQFCLNDINYSTPVQEGQVIPIGLYSVEALKIFRCMLAYANGQGYVERHESNDPEFKKAFKNGMLTSHATFTSEHRRYERSIWSGISQVARGEHGEICLVIMSYIYNADNDLKRRMTDSLWHDCYIGLKRLLVCLRNNSDPNVDIVDVKTNFHFFFRFGCYPCGHLSSHELRGELQDVYKISKSNVEKLMNYFKAKNQRKPATLEIGLMGQPWNEFENVEKMAQKEEQTGQAKLLIRSYEKYRSQIEDEAAKEWKLIIQTPDETEDDWNRKYSVYMSHRENDAQKKEDFILINEQRLAEMFPEEM